MNSVRQVSIVLREVAEMLRVTDNPKKLKPLCRSSQHLKIIRASWSGEANGLPNTNHDQDRSHSNGSVVKEFMKALPRIKIAATTSRRLAHGRV